MTIHLHEGDLPEDAINGSVIAIDTETMGLNPYRDRLCLIQLSAGDGDAHLVKFVDRNYDAPQIRALLADPKIVKLFHFARFDIAVLRRYLGVLATPVYCTKIASRLTRTFTDRHGLKDLCRELINVDISKQQQTSDWGAAEYTDAQKEYAANDVLYLHELKSELDQLLKREGRQNIAEAAFAFLPVRAELDLLGWADFDIFAHS